MKRIILLSFFITSCMSSIHQFQQSDPVSFEEYSTAKKVEASAEQFTFLGFVNQTNYVEEAVTRLLETCPNGRVQQIGVVFKTKLGFLSWKNHILLTGYCISEKF
jgi:hypothetical protein